jgi:hypothetical protein
MVIERGGDTAFGCGGNAFRKYVDDAANVANSCLPVAMAKCSMARAGP